MLLRPGIPEGPRCGEPHPRPIKPGLDGGFGNIEHPCDLFQGRFLRHANLKRSTKTGLELLDSAQHAGAPLTLIADLLGIGSKVPDLDLGNLVPDIIGKIEWHLGPRTVFAKKHQRGVDGNPRQPRIKA
jgi:hypothetical protein